MVKARKEQEKTGFDKNTFAVYWTLKQEGIKKAKKHAPCYIVSQKSNPYLNSQINSS
jgi:hypothetical protein